MIRLRFGKEGLEVLPRVREISDVERLRTLKDALCQVPSAAEFAALLQGT